MSASGNRRKFVQSSTQAAVAAAVTGQMALPLLADSKGSTSMSGKINHSVCRWCYSKFTIQDLCVAGKEFGLKSVELLQPNEISEVQKHGLTCAMVSSPTVQAADGKMVGGISHGWNRTQYHDVLLEAYGQQIELVVKAGVNNLICFSGNRDGMDDRQGLENCALGLKRLMPIAEAAGVTITMELLNSRVDHPDYMCDRTDWGVALCQAVGSDKFKLLYDIYHMQIMEGDVIATIRKHHRWISHFHTGGVPGRNEIDDTQELFYPAIMRAIVDSGYAGYVGQEFIPKRDDPLKSLRQGIEICSI
ncbi:MAG TPA: hydroxypyruvate isomerase [Planctomycetaceae bacterium]|nr:hydroxypyruvate isomerase [Planctomycetaceae bacterium]